MVEFDYKVVGEVVGHTSVVVGGYAGHTHFIGLHVYAAIVVESVDYHKRRVGGRIGKLYHGGAFGGRYFGSYVVVGQIHFVIVRPGLLRFVREPRAAFLVGQHQSAGFGHQRECAVIIYPGRGLVGLFEAADTIFGVHVLPSGTVLTGLRSPEIHAPGHCYGRIGVAGGEFESRLGAYERIYKVGGVAYSENACRSGQGQADGQIFFHYFSVLLKVSQALSVISNSSLPPSIMSLWLMKGDVRRLPLRLTDFT